MFKASQPTFRQYLRCHKIFTQCCFGVRLVFRTVACPSLLHCVCVWWNRFGRELLPRSAHWADWQQSFLYVKVCKTSCSEKVALSQHSVCFVWNSSLLQVLGRGCLVFPLFLWFERLLCTITHLDLGMVLTLSDSKKYSCCGEPNRSSAGPHVS